MKKTISFSPLTGKQRMRTTFLLVPKTLKLPSSNIRQWRWLTLTSWIEEWRSYYSDLDSDTYHDGWWVEVEWANE